MRVLMGDQRFSERRRTWNAGLREHFRQLEESWNRAHSFISAVRVAAGADVVARPERGSTAGLPDHGLKMLEQTRPNLLLIGSPARVSDVLRIIARSLASPIASCTATRLALPDRAIGTLAIHGADHLSRNQQEKLHSWVLVHPSTQVIMAATRPLLPLVLRNTFSDVLFYRLNLLSVVIDDEANLT
jgi:hypothetical protein